MKKFRFIPAILCGIMLLSLTSCMDDGDDYKAPTKEEIEVGYLKIMGTHEGEITYQKKIEGTTSMTETATRKIEWSVNSKSELVIKEFPSDLLAMHITEKPLAEALAKMPAKDLKCNMGWYSVEPIVFLLNPVTPEYNVVTNDRVQKIQLAFYINTPYSFGQYDEGKKEMSLQIIMGGVYVDGKLQGSLLAKDIPFIIKTKKQTVTPEEK